MLTLSFYKKLLRFSYTSSRLYFEQSAQFETNNQSQQAIEDNAHKESWLLCIQCKNRITSKQYKISKAGSFDHYFVNPQGLQFHIACFSTAPGCVFLGTKSPEWSWFSGYCWQVGCCKSCGLHLGWQFSHQSDQFDGLILDQLIHPANQK